MNYNELWHLLVHIYDEGEAKAIARMVYDVRFGVSWPDICVGKDTQLSANSQAELEEISRRLLKQEPIQYVLGQADFCDRTFLVNEHVLIPRPETEELCRWITSQVDSPHVKCGSQRVCPPVRLLDIGTGSGCIAITLAAELSHAEVTACDISAEALAVAEANAKRYHVQVAFEQLDVLNIPHSSLLHSQFDIIVSNPPYICNKERAKMEKNVLEYEPHTALFVPDDDPLLFYRAIAQYGHTTLKEGGWLYFEINPLYAPELCDMLCSMQFYHIEIKEDQYARQRMIRAQR